MKKHDKDRSEQMPLLYISQPNLKTPAAPMQQSFILKQSSSNSTVVGRKEEDKPKSILTKSAFNEEDEQERADSFVNEMEAGIPSAATAAVLEDVDFEEEEDVLEVSIVEEQEAVSETNIVEEQEAVSEISSVEEQEAVSELDSIEQEETDPDSSISEGKEEPNLIIRKAFRDLNTEEKLSYLLHRPHYIPKILCEVEAKTETYVGFIVSFDNDVVMLRTQAQFITKKILYQDIIDIRMRVL